MAADGGCGDSVEQYRVEVKRLTQELAEANREKIRAAECGLVVLEENQALKQKCVELETEQEALRKELEQLQEVSGVHPEETVFMWSPGSSCGLHLNGPSSFVVFNLVVNMFPGMKHK